MKRCTLLALALVGCAKRAPREVGDTTVVYPVHVQPVTARPLQYSLQAVGSVEAFENISVSARVAGVVERVLFSEGDAVKRGQTLVEIGLERYVLAVKAADAALQRAAAAKAEAEASLARRDAASATSPGLIPGEELETWRTRVSSLNAAYEQAKVALESAQLNLRDAHVRAPVDGTIQTRDAHTGQYVEVGTSLAGLLRRDPLLVRFAVSESDAERLHVGMPLTFRMRDSANDYGARIAHIAASADVSRMVAVTARVQDSRKSDLRPGAFAQIVVPIGSVAQAPAVPQGAVRPSERGYLAFVVDANSIAIERQVKLGLRTSDGWIEVREGLDVGEDLVVRGLEPLRNGAHVKIERDASATGALEPS